MNSEHHKTDGKGNYKGANYDIDREIGGSSDNGEYLDSRNGRTSSVRSNAKAWEKISGEELEHSNLGTPVNYSCIGTINVKGQKLMVWVDPAGAADPYIQIDGVIVAQSSDLGFSIAHHLQMDKNDNCIGGEVFITDYNQPPYIFDVKDLTDSLASGSTRYFADFNKAQYQVNLQTPLNIPVFKRLVNVGGGGGLPVGQYVYKLRFSNKAGDKTNFTPTTPPIPVPRSHSDDSRIFPATRTYGDGPDITSNTSWGVEIMFRVDNTLNYDYIEVVRVPYNVGGGVSFVPATEIVAKISLAPGELSVKTFIDPVNSNVDNEVITDEDELGNQFFQVAKAKGIRYFDKRVVLMNVCTESRDTELEFLGETDAEMFPITKNIGTKGHSEIYNHVYNKGYMSGERHGFAVVGFDGAAGTGFAQQAPPAFIDYKFPNRRDALPTGDSLDNSEGHYVGIKNDNTSGPNFEVFDMTNVLGKSWPDTIKNILDQSTGNEPYTPFLPTEQSDSYTDHEYVPTVSVNDDALETYNPIAFAPEYLTKGMAVKGLTNFPSWMKSFSMVRTAPAGRVVCQGLGMYSMTQRDGTSSGVGKATDKLWFYSSDIESGLVSPSVVDDIKNNPGEYKIELQSPLGFFSEVYSFDETVGGLSDKLIDMISYARIQRDDGQINPGEDSSMGVAGPGGRHVGFERWRNVGDAAPSSPQTQYDVTGFSAVAETKRTAEGVHFEIELGSNIYNTPYLGGTADSDTEFQTSGAKAWHEPFYIVNIIREGARVQDLTINDYHSTGHYQKIESKISRGDGAANQEFILVDERKEDCLGESGSAIPRYVYLRDDNGNELVWMDVTHSTAPQITSIQSDITTLGFHTPEVGVKVVGIYTGRTGSNGEYLVFNQFTYYPPSTRDIYVKYDNRLPIKFFGGDTTIGESIFAPLDREATGDDNEDDTQFRLDAGWPFKKYIMNDNIHIINNATGVNKIQDSADARIGYIRQMLMMFCSENRSPIHLTWNESNETGKNTFPLIHYVMRPNRFDSGADLAGNNIYDSYETDYPGEKDTFWNFGGFKYYQNTNIDYATHGPVEYFSKPKIGYEEQTCFCTRVMWSLSRPINVQDAPGLKTFLAGNTFDLADDTGAIKRAYSAITGGKGENLYALTEHGVCLVLTKKSILSNINADNIELMAADEFVGGEYWLSRDIGVNDEMWRSAAESTVTIKTESGSLEKEAIFWANKHSSFRMIENQIKDIGDLGYFSKLNPVLKSIADGYNTKVTAVYDETHNEYWLEVEGENENLIYVFGQNSGAWQGEFTYNFDRFLYINDKVYGMKNGEVYELDKGFVINGEPIEAWLIQTASSDQKFEKEFIRVQSNCTDKPTRVEFLDEDLNVMCALDPAIQGTRYLKKYDGWEQHIPRMDSAYDPDRKRVQRRLLIYKIIHNLQKDFKIIDNFVKYKILK